MGKAANGEMREEDRQTGCSGITNKGMISEDYKNFKENNAAVYDSLVWLLEIDNPGASSTCLTFV